MDRPKEFSSAAHEPDILFYLAQVKLDPLPVMLDSKVTPGGLCAFRAGDLLLISTVSLALLDAGLSRHDILSANYAPNLLGTSCYP